MDGLLIVSILALLWGSSHKKKAQQLRHERGIRLNDLTNATLAAEARLPVVHAANSATNSDSFGDGTYLVGVDIKPGLYRAPGVSGTQLAWARLRTVQGTDHDVIAGYQGSAPGLVEILNQDFAFWSQNSGGWHLVLEGIDIHGEVGHG